MATDGRDTGSVRDSAEQEQGGEVAWLETTSVSSSLLQLQFAGDTAFMRLSAALLSALETWPAPPNANGEDWRYACQHAAFQTLVKALFNPTSGPVSQENVLALRRYLVMLRRATQQLVAWHVPRKSVKLYHPIGSGRFGNVFCGTYLDQPAAVKTAQCSDARAVELLQREADLLKDLRHPNVCELFGVVFNEDVAWVILDLMSGSVLDMLREKPFSTAEVVDTALHVAAGMEFVHDRNVLHCDLAARNILVNANGQKKISDLGLARLDGSEACRISSKNPVPFALRWCPPELFSERQFAKPCDVWAFGVFCYELLTAGQTPYRHMTNKEVKQCVVDEGYRLPKPNNECPKALFAVVQACWLPVTQRSTFSQVFEHLMGLKADMALDKVLKKHDPSERPQSWYPCKGPYQLARVNTSLVSSDLSCSVGVLEGQSTVADVLEVLLRKIELSATCEGKALTMARVDAALASCHVLSQDDRLDLPTDPNTRWFLCLTGQNEETVLESIRRQLQDQADLYELPLEAIL